VRAISEGLAERLGVSLDETPAQTPLLARGAEVYRSSCASCHGDLGLGNGPAAAGLDPAPANLADGAALRDASPLDFYRRITIGVAGTAMPSYEGTLTADDRWAAAVYATLLRLPDPRGPVPDSLARFARTAAMSDAQLLAGFGAGSGHDPAALARLAAVRRAGTGGPSARDAARVFATVRSQIDSTLALAGAGKPDDATSQALDAYMTFEQVERTVRAKDAGLAVELETAFADLRARAGAAAGPAELGAVRATLGAGLVRAEQVIGARSSPAALFGQSLVLMLREGLEAILIVGALLTFLVKTGAGDRRRDIHLGVGAALAASLLTALLIETVFHLSPANQELLEGITMVVATAVLFYVSYWLLSKLEVAKWTRFVRSRVQDAVTSGSTLALATAAFLAVYREGFETILFYKALFASGGEGSAVPVLGGMAAGTVALAVVYVAIDRFGVRLPLKPFFGLTSAFLYLMAFIFAGKGIAELQAARAVGTTYVPWAPSVPGLGIFPTVETMIAQGLLTALALGALAWTFLIEPRRARAALAATARDSTASSPAADLTDDVRAEIERVRRALGAAAGVETPKAG
jgi:high-affinity iron transporter